MAAKSRTMAQQKTKEAYCFIVPAFIYMILVLGYPIVYNIILSLKDVNVKNLKSGTSVFVGLQNYIDLFHDPTFLCEYLLGSDKLRSSYSVMSK